MLFRRMKNSVIKVMAGVACSFIMFGGTGCVVYGMNEDLSDSGEQEDVLQCKLVASVLDGKLEEVRVVKKNSAVEDLLRKYGYVDAVGRCQIKGFLLAVNEMIYGDGGKDVEDSAESVQRRVKELKGKIEQMMRGCTKWEETRCLKKIEKIETYMGYNEGANKIIEECDREAIVMAGIIEKVKAEKEKVYEAVINKEYKNAEGFWGVVDTCCREIEKAMSDREGRTGETVDTEIAERIRGIEQKMMEESSKLRREEGQVCEMWKSENAEGVEKKIQEINKKRQELLKWMDEQKKTIREKGECEKREIENVVEQKRKINAKIKYLKKVRGDEEVCRNIEEVWDKIDKMSGSMCGNYNELCDMWVEFVEKMGQDCNGKQGEKRLRSDVYECWYNGLGVLRVVEACVRSVFGEDMKVWGECMCVKDMLDNAMCGRLKHRGDSVHLCKGNGKNGIEKGRVGITFDNWKSVKDDNRKEMDNLVNEMWGEMLRGREIDAMCGELKKEMMMDAILYVKNVNMSKNAMTEEEKSIEDARVEKFIAAVEECKMISSRSVGEVKEIGDAVISDVLGIRNYGNVMRVRSVLQDKQFVALKNAGDECVIVEDVLGDAGSLKIKREGKMEKCAVATACGVMKSGLSVVNCSTDDEGLSEIGGGMSSDDGLSSFGGESQGDMEWIGGGKSSKDERKNAGGNNDQAIATTQTKEEAPKRKAAQRDNQIQKDAPEIKKQSEQKAATGGWCTEKNRTAMINVLGQSVRWIDIDGKKCNMEYYRGNDMDEIECYAKDVNTWFVIKDWRRANIKGVVKKRMFVKACYEESVAD